MNRLNEIEARANAATEGPWDCQRGHDTPSGRVDAYVLVADGESVVSEASNGNAEFIAHARTDVPDMAAALRAVLEMHELAHPITAAYGTQEGGDYCRTCAENWPCPTVTAIRRHLGDDL